VVESSATPDTHRLRVADAAGHAHLDALQRLLHQPAVQKTVKTRPPRPERPFGEVVALVELSP
jgi:hypothetical protein